MMEKQKAKLDLETFVARGQAAQRAADTSMESRSPSFYLLKEKTPVACSFEEWAEFFSHDRVVAVTKIAPRARVSTVFIGLDSRFGQAGPPLVFETMVFGGPLNGHKVMASTWDEAERFHRSMIARAKVEMKKWARRRAENKRRRAKQGRKP
jgi:hypothetical protein